MYASNVIATVFACVSLALPATLHERLLALAIIVACNRDIVEENAAAWRRILDRAADTIIGRG